jgi:hypothetical protein
MFLFTLSTAVARFTVVHRNDCVLPLTTGIRTVSNLTMHSVHAGGKNQTEIISVHVVKESRSCE